MVKSNGITITVAGLPPLSASAGVSPASVTVGQAAYFTSAGSGGSGYYSFKWAFDDGTASTSQDVSKTFSTAGTHTGTVTVTDTTNNTRSTASASVSVSAATVYSIDIYASPSTGGSVTNAGSHSSGSQFSISSTATPASDYSFVHWALNGNVVSTALSVTITVTGENESLEAFFTSAV